MTERQIYDKARRKVMARKKFYIHCGIYVFGIFILFLLNYTVIRPWEPWFIFPAMGWGLALLIHAISVFVFQNFDRYWEEEAINKEMEKLKMKQNLNGLPQLEPPQEDRMKLKDFDALRKNFDDQEFV